MSTKAHKPPPLEKDVQSESLGLLKSNGIEAFRRNVMAMGGEHKGKRWFVRAGEPGMSDIWGIIPGTLTRQAAGAWKGLPRHFEAECKRLGERPTLEQVLWLIRMNDLTGAAFWFDSTEVLVKVMRCLIAGGRVVYLDTTRRYGKATGPSGDYEIDWPD
jgi:hypothetical protein